MNAQLLNAPGTTSTCLHRPINNICVWIWSINISKCFNHLEYLGRGHGCECELVCCQAQGRFSTPVISCKRGPQLKTLAL